MPIPAGVVRCSIIGHAIAGEIFDTSFWVTAPDVAGDTEANELAAGVAAAFQAECIPALPSKLPNTSGYDSIRTYVYSSGGPSASSIGEAPIVGGVGMNVGGTLPLSTCMVASLRSGLAGRRHRGRMYLPATQAAISGHLFSTGQSAEVSLAMADFFTAVNALPLVGDVVVVSQVAGTTIAVTRVIVDSKPDVQRRRANGLAQGTTVTSPVT